MTNLWEGVVHSVERKSAKYKSFPNVGFGLWGPEVREKHQDKIHEGILARIKHISGRIDSYLPPNEKHYKVDQTLALDLENSFDELAQLYLKYSNEGYGKYLYPENEDGKYSYEVIKALDEKLEKIHRAVLRLEKPFFDEIRGEIFVDKNNNPIERVGDPSKGDKIKKLSDEEKVALHEKGLNMIREVIRNIHILKNILENRLPITNSKN